MSIEVTEESAATAAGGDGSGGLILVLSEGIGAPEAAIRLLLTIVAGYPIAALYRCLVVHQSFKPLHHIFFALCGFGLCIFNYGFDTYHSLIAIWITYLLARLLHHAPQQLVIVNMVFHMSYLLIGYYCTASSDYDILWTMPHCVLVLRMIGFGFDVSDGRKPRDKLSKEQQETALTELPTLLELSAYAYFPCAFLIGPQFPFSRYKHFIAGDYSQYGGYIQAGVKRMALGVMYLGVRQVGTMMLPDDYLLTDAYRNQPFVWRLIYLGLWGKQSLYKYISCWLLTEGAIICMGFSYAGKTADGQNDWSGCSNVKLVLLETGHTMYDYVQSFNVNTNHWVAEYIYKRLKFLNNRTVSYAAALGFLAVWHGFHSGYYMAFIIEYMIVTTEKQIETVYNSSALPAYETNLAYKCLKLIVLKSYNIIYMGWCLTPFILLSFSRWQRVMATVNYFGFVYVGIWFIIHQLYQYNKRANARFNEESATRSAPTLSPTLENERRRKVD